MSMISTDFHNASHLQFARANHLPHRSCLAMGDKQRFSRFFRVGVLTVPSSPAVQATLFCPSSRNYSCHLSSVLAVDSLHPPTGLGLNSASPYQDYDLGPFSSNVIQFVGC